MIPKQRLTRLHTHLDRREHVGDGNAADDEEDAVADEADGPVEGALDEHASAEGPLLLGLLQVFCKLVSSSGGKCRLAHEISMRG